MQKRIQIKNHQQEIQLITKRLMFGLIVICICISLLIVRLAFLQFYKQNIYVTLSTKNWLDLVPIEPTRGLIYDRNGLLLAENIPVFSLDVFPFQVADLPKALNALSKIIYLSDEDLAQFHREQKQHRRFDEIPLKFRLTEEEVARFSENQHRFRGFFIKARLMRHYPLAAHFSHVLGYVGRINTQELSEIDPINYSGSNYIGKLGIEKFYEQELHGKVGYEEVENDASGKPVRILKEIKSIPGNNIYLTIDSRLQLVAEKALAGHQGAIVIMQPSSGEILAMVSEPSYDPNLFVTGINQKDYHLLQTASDRPLFNRALRGLYPPASTVKPYYALKGLEENLINADTTIADPGWFLLNNSSHVYHEPSRLGHGIVDLNKALAVSCDIYFYNLAVKMGIHRLDDILAEFGFGELTGIDLDEELPGLVATPLWKQKAKGMHWYPGDTVNSGIGQGFMQATPLQLVNAVTTLANRGQRFMPYLLLGEQAPHQAYVKQQPTLVGAIKLHDPKEWDVIINAMQNVVNLPQGTAHRWGHPPYTVAAKTGTAQMVKRSNPNEQDNQDNLPKKLRDHHLLVAFAPVDQPKIAIAVVSENSNAAVAAARDIFDYYLKQKPVEMQDHAN